MTKNNSISASSHSYESPARHPEPFDSLRSAQPLRTGKSRNRIYLDYAATSPIDPQVVAAMQPFLSDIAYNPSSVHTEGRAARAALDDARDRIAQLLGVKRNEIVFTASGSESDTLALIGAARAACRVHQEKTPSNKANHIVSSAIEHHAVLHALDALRDEGFEITLLGVDANGQIDVKEFASALRPNTVLASIMYANNEIGSIQPIAELARIARARGVLFHTDAVQAPGYLSLDVRELGVDLLSLSAHKFYGPKGVGLLYVRSGVPIEPLVYGGSQEFGKRAGTENVAGIIGMARALELALDNGQTTAKAVEERRNSLERLLLDRIPGSWISGAGVARLPNIISLAVPEVDSEQLVMALDLGGIAVSSGSACSSGAVQPSHVIAALQSALGRAGVIRISLGRTTTDEEAARAGELIPALSGGSDRE